nr:helix-turn-helix transcriptional regulator [uncultured Clostridium sp.]
MSITGQRIKKRRKQLEMSADDVANLLGVSRSTIFRYENGYIEKVPANILEKLAEILKTNPAYLIGRQDYYTDNRDQDIYLNTRQRGTVKFEDEILLKETADDSYHTDEESRSIGQETFPDDSDKIAVMIEIYLTLTDAEKEKAYDYFINLSKQPMKGMAKRKLTAKRQPALRLKINPNTT